MCALYKDVTYVKSVSNFPEVNKYGQKKIMVCSATLPNRGSPIQKPVNQVALQIKLQVSIQNSPLLKSISEQNLMISVA